MGYRTDRYDPTYLEEEERFNDWEVTRGDQLPSYLFAGIYLAAWLAMLPQGGMANWGVSAKALAEGRFSTLGLHMFAHAGLMHLTFNTFAILALGPLLTSLFGRGPQQWARFITVLIAGSMSGALIFLLFHPHGTVPLVGASGGLFAVVGMLARTPTQHGALAPLFSAETKAAAQDFVKNNIWLVIIFTLPLLIAGQEGGLAWEAHLGGFLFGLLSAPWFVRPTTNDTPAPTSA